MKKVILAAAIMLAGFMGAKAQPTEGFTFGAGVRLALPIGDFGDFSSFGLGGEVRGNLVFLT